MSTFMNKLSELANSPQGKKLTERAQKLANDPKTKAQIENAKRKLAEIRGGGSTGGTGGASHDTPDGPRAA
jgi:hypothetical protein